MNPAWESATLSSVPREPRLVAGDVAADLRMLSDAVIDVARSHLEALDSALALDLPELLVGEKRWQEVRLRSVGAPFGPEEVDRSVNKVLNDCLPGEAARALAAMHEAVAALSPSLAGPRTVPDLGAGPARDYLDAALNGRRDDAIQVIREASATDLEVAEIMLGILEPAQNELGRLWERGEITIAHEHYVTAITQMSLSMLYPRLLVDRIPRGRNLVATTAAFETHEVGIRMISDLLEQDGWHTTFLGADVPVEDVVETVAEQRAHVLAVSATMVGHIRGVRELIRVVRADARCEHVRVLVGGRPFSSVRRLGSMIGADASAESAREALAVCRGWDERDDDSRRPVGERAHKS